MPLDLDSLTWTRPDPITSVREYFARSDKRAGLIEEALAGLAGKKKSGILTGAEFEAMHKELLKELEDQMGVVY